MLDKTNSQQPQINFGKKGPINFTGEKPVLKSPMKTLKRILVYMLKFKKEIIIAFISAIVATSITIIGTRLNGYVIDTLILEKNLSLLAIICLVMVAVYIVNVIATYLQNILMIRTAQNTSAYMRRDLFKQVQRLPLEYYDSHGSGDIMSRLSNDVDNINTALSQTVVQLFTSAINVVGTLGAMLFLSPILTVICIVATPLTFIVTKTVAKWAQRFFIGQQDKLGYMNAYIEETISGQKVMRMFSREEKVVNDFNDINSKYISDAFKAGAASGVIGPCNNMINNFSYLLVAVVGGVFIINGMLGITVGIIFSFLLYMRNFTNPINNILSLTNTLQLAIASAERVFETIDEKLEQDGENSFEINEVKGNIQFIDVDFSYVPDKSILNHANISAEPGQTIAIVGPTGAGKTTIISLLTKFYNIDSGKILIDDIPIENITHNSIRNSVSLVLQDTFLFSVTIRENIRYGRLDASDEEVTDAAKQAYAHDFIMQLPLGYDTVLSDNGQNLSQGQRQLLNIARSIISKASVLILDEATSSVDTRTERIIQNALLKLMQGKTCFVIAHRLSTIKNADKILVINKGRIVEQGTHSELLESNGYYTRLYNSQFRNGIHS